MATARVWTIKVFTPERGYVVQGKGKAVKEKELRRICTETAQTTGGEVWVTETNARAWQVWNCPKGASYGYRGRSVAKDV